MPLEKGERGESGVPRYYDKCYQFQRSEFEGSEKYHLRFEWVKISSIQAEGLHHLIPQWMDEERGVGPCEKALLRETGWAVPSQKKAIIRSFRWRNSLPKTAGDGSQPVRPS